VVGLTIGMSKRAGDHHQPASAGGECSHTAVPLLRGKTRGRPTRDRFVAASPIINERKHDVRTALWAEPV
jgi:hypothetical protein